MAGKLPIPVQRTRSHRTLMLAGTAAMLIATSQWARWAGFIDWDLLSAALGLAQSAQMSASSDVGPAPFDCPNHSLDAQSLALSDEMLKSVGKELCSNHVAEAQMLRGTDGSFADPTFATRQRGKQLIRPSVSLIDHTATKFIKAHGFAVASIETPRTVSNREILDEIESRVPNLDILDPCLGRRSSDCGSGGGSEHGDGTHSGGEGSDHDQIDHEDGDHSGGGSGDGSEGAGSGDGEEHSGDDGHDGGGVDTGENEGSHDGEDTADNSHDGGDDNLNEGSNDGDHGGIDTAQEDHGGGDSGGGDDRSGGGDHEDRDEGHSGSGSGGGGDDESHSGSGHS